MSSKRAISRRGFLGASAAVAAAAAIGSTKTAEAQLASAVPAPIAALPVLSGLPRPFTNAERLARIDRAKALMAANKIDAIVLANSTTSSVYFADLRLDGGERLWALVMPGRTKPFLVRPRREHEVRFRGQHSHRKSSSDHRVGLAGYRRLPYDQRPS